MGESERTIQRKMDYDTICAIADTKLPPELRKALFDIVVDELHAKEAAQQNGCSVSTVYSRAARAIRLVRALIGLPELDEKEPAPKRRNKPEKDHDS